MADKVNTETTPANNEKDSSKVQMTDMNKTDHS